jgi:hypothetical protein
LKWLSQKCEECGEVEQHMIATILRTVDGATRPFVPLQEPTILSHWSSASDDVAFI